MCLSASASCCTIWRARRWTGRQPQPTATSFRRTDAACTRKARDYADKSLKLARQLGRKDSADLDFEVLSNAERLLGDIGLHTGDRAAAAGHYARAVHYAHCFEVYPDHQPDQYTWTFEREQRWRVSKRLAELTDAGDSSAAQALSGQIAEFFPHRSLARGHRGQALRVV